MKASELRIGNYIYRNEGDGFKHTSVDIKTFSYLQKSDWEFEGVPLTEDWLIKFDLLLDTESDEIVTYSMIPFQDFTVVLQKNEQGRVEFNNSHVCYINYVHQLQNLYFALTGEELTIKEPEV